MDEGDNDNTINERIAVAYARVRDLRSRIRSTKSNDELLNLERELLEAQRTWTRLKVQKSRMCEPIASRTRRKIFAS